MAIVQVTITEFKQLFPVFNNTTKYPDTIIQVYLDTAQLYISNHTNQYVTENVQKQMIYLMTAHLITGYTNVAKGNTDGGIIQSASVDGVSVSKSIPQTRTALAYWLASSEFGLQLLALLRCQATVGMYFGGTKENVFR